MFFRRNACPVLQRLSQPTLLALLGDLHPAYQMLAGLDMSEWRIVSFDPSTRNVCVALDVRCGFRLLNITVPPIF